MQSDVIRLLAFSGTVYTPTMLVAYGGPWAENYYYETEDVYDDMKLRHFTPWAEVEAKMLRRRRRRAGGLVPSDAARLQEDRRAGARCRGVRREGRRAARTGSCRAWATTGSCGRWRRAGSRITTPSAPPRSWAPTVIGLGQGPRIDRGREARGPARARCESAREHPEHEHDSLRDDERPPVRGRDARRGVSSSEKGGGVLLGDRSVATLFAVSWNPSTSLGAGWLLQGELPRDADTARRRVVIPRGETAAAAVIAPR